MAAKKAKKKAANRSPEGSTKKSPQKSARKTGGASAKRKTAPRQRPVLVADAPLETPEAISHADSGSEPAGDPLRRPVLLFTATTLLVFGAIYYVYGPCSDFSRFSRPAVVSSDSPLPALTGDEAGDAAQAEPDAAFIENLRLAYPKKGAEVDPQLGASLETVARFLKDNPEAKLEIIGHTCNIGQHPDNDRLSLERADAVRDYLVARGVARRRLNAIGLGEREPIASNSSDAGRIRNRRVEFRVSQ